MTDPPDHDVCETCGFSAAANHTDCRRRGAQWELDKATLRERLIRDLRLRPVTDDNRAAYQNAVALLDVGPDSPPLDETRAFEASTWWYVPHVWIGCCGHIVDKATGRVTLLGSVHSLEMCFWAYERGLLDTPCTLVVTRVNDVEATKTLLRQMDNRSPFNRTPVLGRGADGYNSWLNPDEVAANIPATLQAESLWFALPALKKAEETGAFLYQVKSPSSDVEG